MSSLSNNKPTGLLSGLKLGAQLALLGRESRIRVAFTAVAVGMAVAVLLVAASMPNVLQGREDRGYGRNTTLQSEKLHPAANSVLVSPADDQFRSHEIYGRVLLPDGPDAPLPPGVSKMPKPGEMVVSPALKKILGSKDGELLRPRLTYRPSGTIGKQGLHGPQELAFYAHARDKSEVRGGTRLTRFGVDAPKVRGFGPIFGFLIGIGFLVALLPIGVLIATAVRFGGQHKNRRLAAIRLVGADRQTIRNIAVGEALTGAVFGVIAGGLFFLLGRNLVEGVELLGISVFATDLKPSLSLITLITFGVPLGAAAVTLFAMRNVVADPLGVTRRIKERSRRLSWRIAVIICGAALLVLSTTGALPPSSGLPALGAGAVLIGLAILLPWVVERLIGMAPTSRWIPLQLAARRLRLEGGHAARSISGLAVLMAGTIVLIMIGNSLNLGSPSYQSDMISLYANKRDDRTTDPRLGPLEAKLKRLNGVRSVAYTSGTLLASPKDPDATAVGLEVGTCSTLKQIAHIENCKDGDTFVTKTSGTGVGRSWFKPGAEVNVGYRGDSGERLQSATWRVPASSPNVTPHYSEFGGPNATVLATPKAVAGKQFPLHQSNLRVLFDQSNRDVGEHIRNLIDGSSPRVNGAIPPDKERTLRTISRAISIGVVLALILVGTSLFVGAFEQLQERRRVLAVLVAFGTKKSTLAWSVLLQTLIPTFAAIALAIGGGIALGFGCVGWMSHTEAGLQISPDVIPWEAIMEMSIIGGIFVLALTVCTLPILFRLLRPSGLRTE